jgi:hypothetical protein
VSQSQSGRSGGEEEVRFIFSLQTPLLQPIFSDNINRYKIMIMIAIIC